MLIAQQNFNLTNSRSRSYSRASLAGSQRESHGWLLLFPMIEENSIVIVVVETACVVQYRVCTVLVVGTVPDM